MPSAAKVTRAASSAAAPLVPYIIGGVAIYLGYRYLSGAIPDVAAALGDAAGDIGAGFSEGSGPIEETVTRRAVLGYDQAGDDEWFGVSDEGYVQTLTGPTPGTIESSTVPQYSTVDRDGAWVVTVDDAEPWTGGPRFYEILPETPGTPAAIGRWARERADLYSKMPWDWDW